MDYMGVYAPRLKHIHSHGPIWNHMYPYARQGPIRIYMDHMNLIEYMGSYAFIGNHMNPYGPIWNHMECNGHIHVSISLLHPHVPICILTHSHGYKFQDVFSHVPTWNHMHPYVSISLNTYVCICTHLFGSMCSHLNYME